MVPFEDEGQQNPVRGKEPCFVHATEEWREKGDCRNANNPGKDQDTTEEAKQEPTYRFYALYDKVFRADILSHAYTLVRANKGSAGIDGVTFEAIEEREGVSAFLAELQEALRSKTYQASPVKRVMIPKTDGTPVRHSHHP